VCVLESEIQRESERRENDREREKMIKRERERERDACPRVLRANVKRVCVRERIEKVYVRV
jgi:hypothetical protein